GAVALAELAVIPRDAPASRAGRRFDLPGAMSATAGATLLVFALVQGPEVGWAAPAIVVAGVVAVLLL
ncbi:MFS transporter, partial [Amycolatopsis magusensis]|nr:MFS transporter [Amycolatopsis magusensis]